MTTATKQTESAVRKLRDEIHVPRRVFSRLLPVSERLLADLETNKRDPSEAVQRRLNELERLITALKEIIDSEYLSKWLTEPNDAFDGLKPIEVIERGESDRIWRMIYHIASGNAT